MPRGFIDLHTHSTASDGTDTPAQLIHKAARAGLRAVALTDHDTLDGLAEAEAEAIRHGIRFIRGCEFAVNDDEGELHLLGLWMPEPSPRMREALREMQEHRRRRNETMLARLEASGLVITMEEVTALTGRESVGRPHMARAMVARGYVKSVAEAFGKYLGDGAPAFVPRALLSPEEGIALLRDEGAVSVLAHPFLHKDMSVRRLDALLARLAAWGLHALEAYHSVRTARHIRDCLDLAEKHGLGVSGGSDYHGGAKPGITLGAGRGGMRIPLPVLERLEAFRERIIIKAVRHLSK